MSGASRAVAPTRKTNMRPPPARPLPSRSMSATPTLMGRASPGDNLSRRQSPTSGGTKRKEREYEHELVTQETNINVVVRCRGRSGREIKENSGVVVSADGVKGKTVELSMGPNALSNKTYNFDRVFSPAADQGMVFDEVVAPILNEVLDGFNCTIFAYGQTGTGKTYTMSGDISDMLPLSDGAGIIPRVLHSLFNKLDNDSGESTVKCSFIELYNEELRDLLAADESAKLKIFDDASRKSHGATLVQGMEETHIKSASKGIDLLRIGSHRRHIAATKCNDLSSRSHTVFTITTYVKRVSEGGEDFVCSGKLNLVDLAGSENIQRSGAENKRAAEAGLINKSLLTLGRVINALVEKSNHIPYRESKLTRLLQDSLGGRTKTCIIATLSPAKSNLEETISTLDYAFRAKNIRNKPQINPLVSKKTLIREFASEIEKLKGELIATRQRNGVYLTAEIYEELTTESESRRILSEEQKDKIDTMESNLRNKAQELFSLTSNLTSLKKDHDTIRQALDGTQDTLKQTEMVLEHTRQTLSEEEFLRKAHQSSEERLARIGQDLISTLGRTTSDINGLRSKNKRKSDLQALNKSHWTSSQSQVSLVTETVEERVKRFEAQHQQMLGQISQRMQSFVQSELSKLEESRGFLQRQNASFDQSEAEVNEQTAKARDEMNVVLEGINTLRDDLKQKVGEGLDGLSAAAERISAGVVAELESFHSQLHASYSSLGKDLKGTFDELGRDLQLQKEESESLRQQLSSAGNALVQTNEARADQLNTVLTEERATAAKERDQLLSQMSSLLNAYGDAQDKRLEQRINGVREEIKTSNQTYQHELATYDSAMDSWLSKNQTIHDGLLKSRDTVKGRIKQDWNTANQQTTSISNTTRSVHSETMRIVDAQMEHLDTQLSTLNDIVARVQAQNSSHHDAHVASLANLGLVVKESHSSIGNHLSQATQRAQGLAGDFNEQAKELERVLGPLESEVCRPLTDLRADILATSLTDYVPTGETPQKTTYAYSQHLPRTEAHDRLLARYRAGNTRSPSPTQCSPINEEHSLNSTTPSQSPTKAPIFTDAQDPAQTPAPPSPTVPRTAPAPSDRGLRELDINAMAQDNSNNPSAPRTMDVPHASAPKRPHTSDGKTGTFSRSVGTGAKLPSKRGLEKIAEGRENVPLGTTTAGGRVLRRRAS